MVLKHASKIATSKIKKIAQRYWKRGLNNACF